VKHSLPSPRRCFVGSAGGVSFGRLHLHDSTVICMQDWSFGSLLSQGEFGMSALQSMLFGLFLDFLLPDSDVGTAS